MICVGGIVVPSPAPASSVSASTTEVGAKVTVAASATNASVDTASPRFGYAVSLPVRAMARPVKVDDAASDKRDRQQQQAGGPDTDTAAELQIERQIEHRPEQGRRETDDHQVGAPDHRRGEQAHRDHRVGRAHFPGHERGQAGERQREHQVEAPIEPAKTIAGRGERKQQRQSAGTEQDDARDVGAKARARRRPLRRNAQREHRGDHAQRQVDEEYRAPAQILGQQGTEQRAERARGRKHGREVALELCALARRHVLADQRLRQRHQAAAAQALHGARNDQRQQRRGEGAGERCDGKDGQGGEQGRTPSEAVADAAVERCCDRRRQEIGDDDPGQIGESTERCDDCGQRARQDRLVDRGEKHREHDAGKHAPERRAHFVRRNRRGAAGLGGLSHRASLAAPGRVAKRSRFRARKSAQPPAAAMSRAASASR